VVAWDQQVSGWRAEWGLGAEVVAGQRDALLSMRGDVIEGVWLAVDSASGDWDANLPVLIRLADGRQLEVCWMKEVVLSLTWDTIDRGLTAYPWGAASLTWRVGVEDSARSAAGRTVESVAIVERRAVVPYGSGPHPAVTTPGEWVAHGLWWGFAGDGGLGVLSGVDDNELCSVVPEAGPDVRVRPL
jgi:hypothetical protein